MSGFKLKRLGMIMAPQAGEPNEVEGVLNPAAARTRDGQLYLFPRLVARGNYSRIGIARVLFDRAGDPTGVERMGVVLEPEADYELSETGGGCEDPRVSFVEPLKHYVMTYTALSRHGPRIAIAVNRARIAAAEAAIAEIERVQRDLSKDQKDADIYVAAASRVMDLYRDRIEVRSREGEAAVLVRRSEKIEKTMRLAAVKAERTTIFQMLRSHEIGSETAKRLVRELDLLEARYET